MAPKSTLSKTLILVIMACLFTGISGIAQTGNEQSLLPVISGGVGVLGFNGNIGKVQRMGIYSGSRFGYNVGVEELVGGGFGIGLDFLGGKLAKSERSLTANGNFQANIMNIGINFNYHFDNNLILDESSMIAPYISVGFSYLSFNSSSDMIAANGESYYYWSDGSVRNIAQTDAIALASTQLPMDYKYETDLHSLALANEGLNYKQNTFSIPLGLGISWKLTPEFSIDLKATYYLTMTNYIDYISGSGITTASKDAFLYTNVSFHYNFGLSSGSTGKETADAATKKAEDDTYYSSSKTPKNAPKKNSTTAADKKTIAPNTSSKSTAGTTTKPKTTTTTSKSTGTHSTTNTPTKPVVANKIPEDLRIADTNNDGKISSQEINGAIDALFNGDAKYSVPMINKLIDYFFEQQ